MSVSLKEFFYWGVGSVALIALAAPYPDMATILALILIFGVVLTHWSDYASLLPLPAKK